jgi:hypothetical protein
VCGFCALAWVIRQLRIDDMASMLHPQAKRHIAGAPGANRCAASSSIDRAAVR